MINDNLLSEILKDTVKVNRISEDGNYLQFQRWSIVSEEDSKRFNPPLETGWGLFENINIYELANKCKEWASENSYELESSIHMQPKRITVAGCKIHWRFETEDLPYFDASSEPEAIFTACQWILENKETK